MEPLRRKILKSSSNFLEAYNNKSYKLAKKTVKEIEEILSLELKTEEDKKIMDLYRNELNINLSVLKANLDNDIQLNLFD